MHAKARASKVIDFVKHKLSKKDEEMCMTLDSPISPPQSPTLGPAATDGAADEPPASPKTPTNKGRVSQPSSRELPIRSRRNASFSFSRQGSASPIEQVATPRPTQSQDTDMKDMGEGKCLVIEREGRMLPKCANLHGKGKGRHIGPKLCCAESKSARCREYTFQAKDIEPDPESYMRITGDVEQDIRWWLGSATVSYPENIGNDIRFTDQDVRTAIAAASVELSVVNDELAHLLNYARTHYDLAWSPGRVRYADRELLDLRADLPDLASMTRGELVGKLGSVGKEVQRLRTLIEKSETGLVEAKIDLAKRLQDDWELEGLMRLGLWVEVLRVVEGGSGGRAGRGWIDGRRWAGRLLGRRRF
jgi:hypothetical protein